MRLLRVLAAATGFAALLGQTSAAQEGRQFKDAWFWGAKGGALVYSSNYNTTTGVAPSAGIDWLITRTRGGLYVSADYSFFSTQGSFKEVGATGFSDRVVDLKGLQRISLAALAFPLQTPTFHPYAGIGFGMNRISSVAAVGSFSNASQLNAAGDSVQTKRLTFAPFVMAGLQKRLPMFSVFVQGDAAFLQNGYFLHNPHPTTGLQVAVQGGVRYNVGSSIDRAR
jgi:hypothetical protein